MNGYYYDFHIHSCLSPCADNDMTPNNIAGTAVLAGIQIMALTDHNSAKNCPAFFEACKRNGIIPIAGMELTTAEDIHAVCLFETLEAALDFDSDIQSHRIRIPNRTDIFGDQLLTDGEDNVIGTEPDLLPNATDIMIDYVPDMIARYGGICYPAHVDREANGIIATLGSFPDVKGFRCAEFYNQTKKDTYCKNYPALQSRKLLVSSDAHYLWDIRDKMDSIPLEDEPYSSSFVRAQLFRFLKGE